ELRLAGRQLLDGRLALGQLVRALLRSLPRCLECRLGTCQLLLACRERRLELGERGLAALRIGLAPLSEIGDRALELAAGRLEARDLRARLGLLDARIVELRPQLGVGGLTLSHARPRRLEVDVTLAQLGLQAVEGLAAQVLGLAAPVELGLACGH